MKRLVAAFALLLSILVASLWLFRFAPSGLVEPARAVDRAEPSSRLSVVPMQPGVESAERLAQENGRENGPAIAEQRAALVVAVRRVEDESAVADAEVSIHIDRETREARTDAEGRCRFETEPAAQFWWARVAATAETTSVSWEQACQLPSGEETQIVLHVSRGATVAGRVVDASDRPMAGALVKGWCGNGYERSLPPDRTAESGADGNFSLPHVGAWFHVVAEAPGFACIEGLQGELGPGDVVDDARVVVGPAKELRGHVLARSGDAPIEDARIATEDGHFNSGRASAHSGVYPFQPRRAQARSAADGSFTLGSFAVLPSMPPSATVTREGFRPWQGALEPGKDDLVIRLDAGLEVAGRVLDHEGKSVEGARVRCRESQDNRAQATSDARGEFRLPGLGSTNTATLYVHAKGHGILVQQPVSLSHGRSNWFELRLEPPLALAGSVVDGQGRPVPNAEVRIVGDRAVEYADVIYATKMTWEMVLNLDRARTGEDGRFRIDDLYDGTFTVSARTGAEVWAETQARAGSEDLVLVLDENTSERVILTGRVRDAVTAEPIRDFTVVPMMPNSSGSLSGDYRRFTDSDGRFRIEGLRPGPIGIIVQANGYASWRDEPREYVRGEHALDLALYGTRTLSLRISDRDGSPAKGDLLFYTRDGQEIWIEIGPNRTTTRLTLEEGKATAKGLPADWVQLVVRTLDRGSEWPFDVDLRVQPAGTLELTLPVDTVDAVWWSAVVCGTRPGADLRRFDGQFRETWIAELGPAADAWLIDRPVEARFVTASGDLVATASAEPDGSGGFKTSCARGAWRSDLDRATPTWMLQIPIDIVRVELRASGYHPLDFALDPVGDRWHMRTVFLEREP